MDGAKRWVVAGDLRSLTDPIEVADRLLDQIPFVAPGLRHEILTRIEALRTGGNDTLLCSGLLAEIDEEYLGTHVPLRWLEREEARTRPPQAQEPAAEEDLREIAARSPDPPSTPKRRWCGRCDQRDRLITPMAEGPRRCPDCHPLGREPINGDLRREAGERVRSRSRPEAVSHYTTAARAAVRESQEALAASGFWQRHTGPQPPPR